MAPQIFVKFQALYNLSDFSDKPVMGSLPIKRNFKPIFLLLVVAALAPIQPSLAGNDVISELVRISCKTTSRPTSQEPVLNLPKIKGATDWGPHVWVPAGRNTWPIDSIDTLTLGQYNLQELSEYRGAEFPSFQNRRTRFYFDPSTGGRLKHSPEFIKPTKKLRALAATITRENPDIAVVEEVENIFVLQKFNEMYLGNQYKTILIPGNDQTKSIGFLVKTDLPFDLEVQSFKNVGRVDKDKHLFTRDLPVMLVREAGSGRDSQPLFAVMGAHFKALQKDSLASIFRTRELEIGAAMKISGYYKTKFGAILPQFLLGDLNEDVNLSSRLAYLWKYSGFKDVFNTIFPESSVPERMRVTHTAHPSNRKAIRTQLDTIAGSRSVQHQELFLDAKVIPYLGHNGGEKPIPMNIEERDRNPSDHFMMIAQIDFAKLLRFFRLAQSKAR